MSELIPKGIPKGKEIVQEGRNLGKTIEMGRSAFCREKNVRCEGDYKQMCAEKGHITWQMIMGLSSVDEQVEALKYLYEWGKKTGVVIDRCTIIPNMRMGLPEEMWDKAPKGTSFMLESLEDYVRIIQAAPIQPTFGDFHIGSPASVRNVTNALRAGAGYIGTLSQYSWDYPYWKDDVAQVVEVVKAIGIMAEKRKDNIIAYSYESDGMPSQFMDWASVIGYVRLEKYIVDELCGANYAIGYGGLTGNIPVKIANWLALYDVLKADHNVISFIYGNTIDVTEDASSNYAIVTAEVIPFVITEQIYKTGASLLLVPAQEMVRVPTKEEIAEVFKVARVAQTRAKDYEKMLDFSYVNEMRSLLADKGNQFFMNIKRGLPELGVDIADPVQVLLSVRRLGAAKLEELFHPGERDSSLPRCISPFIPTELVTMSINLKDEALKKIYSEQLADTVRGKKIVVGSTDTHEFGLYVISSVLEHLGARVINGGIDLDAEEILDLASEAATPYMVISTHNGLCLDYGRHLMGLVKQRNQKVKVFMGGRLDGIVEGGTEPIDVSDRLIELGISPCNDVCDLIKEIAATEEA